MDSAQEMSAPDMDDLGEDVQAANEGTDATDVSPEQDASGNSDPLYVQKRLKQQKRAHEREIRELHGRLNDMQSRFTNPAPNMSQGNDGYAPQGGMDEQIHKAVAYALSQQDAAKQQAAQQENNARMARKHQELDKHLDALSDKYEDFDDVVRDGSLPFTTHMRNTAILLPKTGNGSAGEVLYKLGQNRQELERISKLPPDDQADEMLKLSYALMNGGETKSPNAMRQLGNIKSNPVTNSHSVTDKTPIGDLRKRMRANWK